MDISTAWTSFLLTTVILLHIRLPTIICKDVSLKTESVIDELLKRNSEQEQKNLEQDRKLETITADLKATRELLAKAMIALTLISTADTNQTNSSSGGDDGHVIRQITSLLSSIGNGGRDGRDGNDGINGQNGIRGKIGKPGINRKNGKDGKNGINGENGKDGKNGINGKNGRDGGVTGAVYTRWGHTSCKADAELLYAGFAAGGAYWDHGGGVDYQCLHDEPQYNDQVNNLRFYSTISGVEYHSYDYGIFPDAADDRNVPCARCYTPRSAVVMIPSRKICPSGWTKEYEGFLMSSKNAHDHPMTCECVDQYPKYATSHDGNKDGALLFFVIPDCEGQGTIEHCGPYDDRRVLTCVVCSK